MLIAIDINSLRLFRFNSLFETIYIVRSVPVYIWTLRWITRSLVSKYAYKSSAALDACDFADVGSHISHWPRASSLYLPLLLWLMPGIAHPVATSWVWALVFSVIIVALHLSWRLLQLLCFLFHCKVFHLCILVDLVDGFGGGVFSGLPFIL